MIVGGTVVRSPGYRWIYDAGRDIVGCVDAWVLVLFSFCLIGPVNTVSAAIGLRLKAVYFILRSVYLAH